jgi:hypothetical protein
LLLVTTIALAASAIQQDDQVAPEARLATSSLPTPTTMPSAAPTGLGQDDPALAMSAVSGEGSADIVTSSVQVLIAGKVTNDPASLPIPVKQTTITRWVKNAGPATLWSGPTPDAAAFTDVPPDSFFRVTGPDQNGRTPVYYVGDGLLREPGNGWLEALAVLAVEAPAPGQVPAVDADARQPLPLWVQAHRATTLWSGHDDQAVSLTDLPQWTFLKAVGLERDGRLLVNYAGDYASRQSGIGWVDQDAVGPAGDPGVWITNHRATALWSGVDAKAIRFTDVPQWTKFRIVPDAPPDADRLKVEFFGDGATRLPGTAWVARADIGPITPPVPLPASIPIKQNVERHAFISTTEFIETVGSAAQRSMKTSRVPASVTIAQAILESDWGRSRLTRLGNNLFGIKAMGTAQGPAGVVTLATWEHTPDGDVIVQAPFRAYFTLEQSIDDHARFFNGNRRYAAAMVVADDARAFANAIQDAGYATDPSYATKLIGLMDRYDLYRFDQGGLKETGPS